jgi:hypothetical protein
MKHLFNRRTFDRAAMVTTNIISMIATAPTVEQLQQAIEASLRDEFADIERQVAGDKESGDA